MRRSDVNELIRRAGAFLAAENFKLPPFADWTPADWRERGEEVRAIVERRLGWDVTDFGSGRFEEVGLLLFTLRNGDPRDLGRQKGRLYAEKILIVGTGQVTPLHLHRVKTEDVINRGGGRLVVRLHGSTKNGELEDADVRVLVDGIVRTVPAGGTIALAPGESITLPDGLYHEFWAEEKPVLAGEVSLVNDDETDNVFFGDVGRFPEIEEDDEPSRLLVTDYERFLPFMQNRTFENHRAS